ncbi:MAG: hypothetical protein ACOYNS_01890 [Bacteroidota bacterium]
MKNNKWMLVCAAIMMMTAQSSYSQGNLETFGFYQAQFVKMKGDYSVKTTLPAMFGGTKLTLATLGADLAGSNIQQLNLFFRKELSQNFTSWISLQFVNNFSSTSQNVGKFSLDEVWLKYDYSTALSFKAGLLVPRFNYLHEIKNKTPLLPYISRPLVYESSVSGTIDPSTFLPEKAIAQISGYLPVNDLTFEYSMFVGQLDKNYQQPALESNGISGGLDSVNFKAFGGRAGVKYGDAWFGVSATTDKQLDNMKLDTTRIQHINRTRIGLDVGYTIYNVFIEGEYIKVSLDSKVSSKDLGKEFYYATIGYNFTEDLFAYGTFSKLKDKQIDFLSTGMTGTLIGAGYRPDPSVVVKAQYSTYNVKDAVVAVVLPLGPPIGNYATNANLNLDYKTYALAVSVLF